MMNMKGKRIKLRSGQVGYIQEAKRDFRRVIIPGQSDLIIETRLIRRAHRQRPRGLKKRGEQISLGYSKKRWHFKEVGGL